MDRSVTVKLINKIYTTDSIGQQIDTETPVQVFAKVDSVSRDEFFTAGSQGIKPSFQIAVNSNEYGGQNELEYNGQRYGVYRTYQGKNEITFLYVEEKRGV